MERACLLGAVRCHKVTSDDKAAKRGDALEEAIQTDIEQGLIPFFVRIVTWYLGGFMIVNACGTGNTEEMKSILLTYGRLYLFYSTLDRSSKVTKDIGAL